MKKQINHNFLINTLINLVKTPSISGEEKQLAYEVARIFEDFGYKPRIDEYNNIVAKIGSGKPILLNSHLDTVPITSKWTINPFSGSKSNGKIYGLGASDDKSGIASMIEIARIFSDNEPTNGQVIFIFTSNEETVKKGGRENLFQIKADCGICLDNYIDVANSTVEIGIGCKGFGDFELEVYGKSYHSSDPEKGVNAIYRAARVTQMIENSKFEEIYEPFERILINVTKISSDGYNTIVPDLCKLILNYRALHDEKREQARKRVLDLIKKSAKKEFKLILNAFHQGYLIDTENKLCKIARDVSLSNGFNPKISLLKYWADAAMFNNKCGIPMLCMGTQTKGQAHVKNEHENIVDLIHGTDLLLQIVSRYLNS